MKVHRNVGGVDRAARMTVGTVLPLVALFAPLARPWRVVAGTLGGIALATALGAWCPLNQALGIDTAHRRLAH